MNTVIWIGILVCLSQSAIFSGLNLAFFSLSRLRLEAEAATGSQAAERILKFRRDSNFLLTTILWGNVSINVLLTLLSNSVLAGVLAFVFSTVVITVVGEILPQAYFSRRAMAIASFFTPLMRFYQFLFTPVARPTAWLLDKWLGKERVDFLRERQLRGVIEQHIQSEAAEVDFIEGQGALNFLEIDDVPIWKEGERIDPESIIRLATRVDLPILPEIERAAVDPFVRQVNASGRKWVILSNLEGEPQLLLDSDAYLRGVLLGDAPIDGYSYCHRPIVISDANTPLGHVLIELKQGMGPQSDTAIVKDIVLLWTEEHKRAITGADILGRLLHGIG